MRHADSLFDKSRGFASADEFAALPFFTSCAQKSFFIRTCKEGGCHCSSDSQSDMEVPTGANFSVDIK